MKNKFVFAASLAGGGAIATALMLLTSPVNAGDDNDNDADSDAVSAKVADKDNEANAKPAGAPDMAEMMKKMEELAAPGPEHHTLASLAGEWDTEARCYMAGPDTPPTVTKGSCKARMILGGRFLQEEFNGDMMGKPFHGVGLTGYDKFNKKFIGTWIDDMGTGIFVSEGTCDPSGKVLTQTGKMDDPMTGAKAKEMKLVTRIVSPDKRIMEMHDVALGEKSKVMEITYVRKEGTEAPSFTAK